MLNTSRNKFSLGRGVGRCLGRRNVRFASCNALANRHYSCPSVTGGITRTITSNAFSQNVLIYNANVNVNVTTGGIRNVQTTLYRSYFSTRCYHHRGSTGVLAVNNHIVNPNLTERVIHVFLSANFSNNHRTIHITGVTRVSG